MGFKNTVFILLQVHVKLYTCTMMAYKEITLLFISILVDTGKLFF